MESCLKEKLGRIQAFLAQTGYEALVIGRRDNFSWLTSGQDSGVVLSSEIGFVSLVITKQERYAIALYADIDKSMQELLNKDLFCPVTVMWEKETVAEAIGRIICGKKTMSDIPIAHADFDIHSIYQLHFPLTQKEMVYYESLGKDCSEVIYRTAQQLEKGMSENQIKTIFFKECLEKDLQTDVLLIGCDDRIAQYRHCTPTDEKLDKLVLISPVFRRNGLHANISRMICLGEAPNNLKEKYDIVSQIQAEIIANIQTGISFSEIYALQKKLYKQFGYETEWGRHTHGAPIGYMISDGEALFDSQQVIKNNQVYEWYVTITGAKSAELVANYDNQAKVLSLNEKWPVQTYVAGNGKEIILPDILNF